MMQGIIRYLSAASRPRPPRHPIGVLVPLRSPCRARLALLAALIALGLPVVAAPLPAETPAAASTEAPAPIAPAVDPGSGGKAFFTDNARILDTIEPIKLGGEAFARRLDSVRTAREPLGLVLSGGSARAFAHIGVLKALEEKGIRPDFIVANSMGAIVGMMYAAGFTPDTIESLVSGISIGSLIDLVLPLSGGFINAGRFAAFVRSIVGDVDIADLPIPIMIIFEDLKSRRQVRVMKGNFADVMAASFALPAVFEPVRIDDYLLIDGGITNLVPASAAYDYSRKVIVSVTMYDKAMKFSNPLTVINRAIDIGKTRSAVQGLVDLKPVIIRNDVESVSYMEFSRPHGIVSRGYVSAQAALPEILAVAEPTPPDPVLLKKNAEYGPLVEAAIDDFVKGNEPPNLPQTIVIPVFRLADDVAGDTGFDLGRRYFGFRAIRRDGILSSGVGLDFSLGDDPSHAWGLVFSASARPVGGFFARIDGRLSGAWRPVSIGLPLDPRHLDLAGKSGFVFGSRHLVFSAFAGGEYGIPFATGIPEWRVFSGLSARTHKVRPLASDASLDWFLDSRGNAGPEWSVRLSSKISAPLGLRFRLAGRDSVFGPGTALKASDGFRGPLPSALSPVWIIGTAEAVWRARFLEFDAGEMVIVQNIEFSPLLDAVWSGNLRAGTGAMAGISIPEMAAGVSASASCSILGLAPFDFSISVTKSLATPAWKVSFNTGRLFR